MKNKAFRGVLLLAFSFLGVSCMHKGPVQPPVAEKNPTRLEKHGHVRSDDYFWMRERENPKVLSHLKAENAYTEQMLKPITDLRETLYKEMRSRMKEDESSAPIKRGDFFYQSRFELGQQYPIHGRRQGSTTAPEKILLNVNELAKGKGFTNCSHPIMSPDQKLFVYGCDFQGRNFFTLKVREADSGRELGVEIPDVRPNVVWAADNRHFFYVKQHPETLRTQWVYRYDLESRKSELIYEEKDETYSVYVYQSLSKNFIFLASHSTLSTEVRYLKADQPLGSFAVFFPRQKEHEYEVHDGGDRFYILTNWQAKNHRVMEAPLNKTDRSSWIEVISHRQDVYLDDLSVFRDHLVVRERKKGLHHLWLYPRSPGQKKFEIPFADSSYVVSVSGNVEFEAPHVRYEYESMRKPETIYDFDFVKKTSTAVKTREVPHYNPELYETERIWITARDGKELPVNLLYKKGFQKNATAPVLVYGYGSYGASMNPWFNSTLFSLIDRGWVYAQTQIRGGSELGRAHYDDGRTMKKLNTFHDFIDTTEALISLNYAHPKRVYAQGGSAGGLLMGTVMNMRPDLYKAMVAEVPFVDVITTMLDDSIPLTTSEYDEWGNPNEKAAYDYILKYSPYDNVKAQAYPHLLVTTGFHDSQVQYWEPAKWVAKLREKKTTDSVILLKTDLSSGHGGASGRYESLKDEALVQGFLIFADRDFQK